ncbi:MAG: class I SAM-dependent methyltransferase [Promethearchaeota archaeon]
MDKGILVDVGSGTGFLSIEIAKRAPKLKIYGIDLSRKMVEIASGNARRFNNIKFKLANAIDLPFENNSIDIIVSTGSFHHWKQPFKVFNECYRVLKDGKEAWIYDGCSKPPNWEIIKLKQNYGMFRYHILNQIQKLHGFPWEVYNTRIKRLLERTKFKKNFQMILTDGWMKIALKK